MELTPLTRRQQRFSRKLVIALTALVVMFFLGWQFGNTRAPATHTDAAHHQTDAVANEVGHGDAAHSESSPTPAFYSVGPFIVLLLCIAFLPLFHKTEHWWECNWNRLIVACVCGLCTLVYYAFVYGHGVHDHIGHSFSDPGWAAAGTVLKNAILGEYIPFIALLFSLYVISGGILIRGHLVGRPRLNTCLIAIGGLMASFIGTTGAAMLLIRPLLKANAGRKYVAHTVVFFIFVVCNTGGCLLPIGDPPLFLGFLRGVGFFWTLSLWPMWLAVNVALIATYFVWDSWRYRSEDRLAIEAPPAERQRFAIEGAVNFLWLMAVIVCVATLDPSRAFPGTHWHAPPYFREITMLGLASLSLWCTRPHVRRENAFNYDAILEVAALFLGIFVCMQSPIQILHTYGSQLGFDTPSKFFWGTGILSSFLDNAPTYVVFFETARTLETGGATVAGVGSALLVAISLGAVFMGAMTYIGNGPNFMVKAIAEKHEVRMPSFFGYLRYSCAVLLPISLIMTWVFLA